MLHRAQQADLVHLAGQPRQVLANLDARHAGGDRLELAANFGRRLGLHIPEVDMAGPAEQKDEDARIEPARRAGCRRRGGAQPSQSALLKPSRLRPPTRNSSRRETAFAPRHDRSPNRSKT